MGEYEAFSKALKNLREIYNYKEPYENIVLAGFTVLYSECMKRALRLMKVLMQNEGYPDRDTKYPRQVLQAAYRHGLIKDLRIWLEALESGKYIIWECEEADVLEFVSDAKAYYFPLFCELQKETAVNWLKPNLLHQNNNG